MAHSDKGKSRRSQQVIKAVKGSTIRNATQAALSGDVNFGEKIYLHQGETLGFQCTCPDGKTCQSPRNL